MGGRLSAPEAHVLVVDDDALIVSLVTMRLEAAGYTVTTANNVAESLKQATKVPVGLVITDIQMPGASGVEGYKKIRQASTTVPVIFMSAMLPQDAVALMPKDPRIRLVFKPIDFMAMRAAIKELTGLDRPL